jgi:hypothetical protein
MGTPLIVDVNDDCKYDLLATDAGGRVWVWELGLSCSSNTIEWGQHGYDPKNTFTYVSNGSRTEGGGSVVSLEQNEPNPFNPKTTLAFTVSREMPVRLTIYDVSGRELRVLLDEIRSAGRHIIEWDGTDTSGRQLGSGVYFYEVRVAGVQASRKLLLLR